MELDEKINLMDEVKRYRDYITDIKKLAFECKLLHMHKRFMEDEINENIISGETFLEVLDRLSEKEPANKKRKIIHTMYT